MIKKNTYLVVIKYYLGFIIIKTKEFRMEDLFAIFCYQRQEIIIKYG